MKKIMGLDFDDTKVEFEKTWKKYYLSTYGETVGMNWGDPEVLRRGHDFINSHHHDLIPAVEGAVETIAILKERRQLVCITARDALLRAPTMRLMEKLFPKVFMGVYFMNYEGKNHLGTKGDLCKGLGVEEFMDDGVHHVISARDAGIRSFLFHTEGNKDQEVSGVVRIFCWKELLEHVN